MNAVVVASDGESFSPDLFSSVSHDERRKFLTRLDHRVQESLFSVEDLDYSRTCDIVRLGNFLSYARKRNELC